jgi:hypothetical protein
MEIINNPPVVGKHPLIDRQFATWWRFLNSWGIAGFLLFLACLGTAEHKYACAMLSLSLLLWGYFVGRKKFPEYIVHLRNENSKRSKMLEKVIFKEHFYKRLHHFVPLILGVSTMGSLSIYPLVSNQYLAYLSFFPS